MGHYRSPDGGETWSAWHTDEELEAMHRADETRHAAELPGIIERGRKLADVEQAEWLPDELGCSLESYRCRRVAMIAHDIVCTVAKVQGLATMTESVLGWHIQQGRWYVRASYDKWGYGSKAHAQAAVVATEAIRASLFDPRGVLNGALEYTHDWLCRNDPESAEEYRVKAEAVAEIRSSPEWRKFVAENDPDGEIFG